jgi:hypothetical protein
MVPHEFERVAAFGEAEALIEQSFELDGFHFGAVLLGLAAALSLLVGFKVALGAFDLAMEEIDERPQQVGEIILKACAGEQAAERLDNGFELRVNDVGLGQWPRVRFVLTRAMALRASSSRRWAVGETACGLWSNSDSEVGRRVSS